MSENKQQVNPQDVDKAFDEWRRLRPKWIKDYPYTSKELIDFALYFAEQAIFKAIELCQER